LPQIRFPAHRWVNTTIVYYRNIFLPERKKLIKEEFGGDGAVHKIYSIKWKGYMVKRLDKNQPGIIMKSNYPQRQSENYHGGE
jgi:hypothetical protein